jgi:polyphosphate:AMP phosphotransferase
MIGAHRDAVRTEEGAVLATAAVGNRVDKEAFKTAEPELRRRLVDAQYRLKDADFPVVIVIAGDDRLAAHRLLHRLNEWLDARLVRTHVFAEPLPDHAERPAFWTQWMALPPRGGMAVWAGGLLRQVVRHLEGQVDELELETWQRHLQVMQRQLLLDGALLVKFYLHTPVGVQRKRLKKARASTDGWLVDERDFALVDHLEHSTPTIERVLRGTSVPGASWSVVEASDQRYVDLTVGETLLAALDARLAAERPVEPSLGDAAFTDLDQRASVLSAVDLDRSLERDEYRQRLAKLQARLHRLSDEARDRGISTVLAFEGWDAAGKGGAIRRVTQALEAGSYRVIPVAAPTAEERRYHYLWRFWRDLPRAGQTVVYDRTWYGRVLVERIEGFATPAEWQRAYDEIVDFEELITARGTVLAKFWLHISPEEQLARFQAREVTSYKQYKITEEDYRNRERWDDYVNAVDQMVIRTSTDFAPWTIVPANDKYAARITVLETVVAALKRRLRGPD